MSLAIVVGIGSHWVATPPLLPLLLSSVRPQPHNSTYDSVVLPLLLLLQSRKRRGSQLAVDPERAAEALSS